MNRKAERDARSPAGTGLVLSEVPDRRKTALVLVGSRAGAQTRLGPAEARAKALARAHAEARAKALASAHAEERPRRGAPRELSGQ